jgi:hypothetical protein
MKTNKVVNLCMMVAAVAAVFAVYPTRSYGQHNCGTSCKLNDQIVLSEGPTNNITDLAVGYRALVSNTALYNTAVGNLALESNTTGEFNTATGNSALEFNTTGPHNTADGTDALVFTTTGGDNTASGYAALKANTTGGGNTASGYLALVGSTGNGNTALGYEACTNVANADNVICIGSGVAGTNTSNTTYVGGIYGVEVPGPPAPGVCINSEGQLGTSNCDPPAQQEVINRQQQQIQAQEQQIADLQQRLSRLESLIAKN